MTFVFDSSGRSRLLRSRRQRQVKKCAKKLGIRIVPIDVTWPGDNEFNDLVDKLRVSIIAQLSFPARYFD